MPESQYHPKKCLHCGLVSEKPKIRSYPTIPEVDLLCEHCGYIVQVTKNPKVLRSLTST